MDVAYFQAKIPLLTAWITQMLTTHASRAKPVASCGFTRLPAYYSTARLALTKVVILDHVPTPPLTEMGLPEFAAFQQTNFAGITYKDTYFVRTDQFSNEGIHFHELVHIVQWEQLGVDRFLLAYAKGLLQYGYEGSPLETMAYRHESRFRSSPSPYGVEEEVLSEMASLQRSVA